MRTLVAASLRFRYLVVFAAGALMLLGTAQLRKTPVDVFPEFAPLRVEIQTQTLGLSASEVEEFVTVPMEQQLNGVPRLETIRSVSVPQLSSITLIFERGTPMLEARQLVSERLDTVAPHLPSWAMPPVMRQPLSSTSRVLKIGMTSERYDLIELSTITRHTIRQRLQRVPGVASVGIWGQRKEQRQVLVDPALLARHDVSMGEVMEATAAALDAPLLAYSPSALVGTGGFIDTPNQRLGVRHVLPVLTPGELAKISLRSGRGEDLQLGDVAALETGHPPLIGDAVVNGGPGLLLVVEKFPNANTLEVTRGVEEALEALRPGLAGIEFDATIFRPATFIETAIDNLTLALLIGCLLVVVILAVFLFEWRTAAISLVSIPLSLLAAAALLSMRGETVNVMVLAGLAIAIGVVVDDAIIDVENIWRRLRQRKAEGSRLRHLLVILDASLEVRRAIVYATLINVVAVVPVFFLEGLSGAFFRPLALSYALAVLASMVVALTVTPALSLILLRSAPLDRGDAPLVRRLKRGYAAVLARVISRPRPSYVAAALVAVLGLAVVPQLGQSLLPDFKERDFLMHWLTKPGTSLPEETRISRVACRELDEISGVRNCGSHIGQALFSDEVVGVDFGENWVSIDPTADYDRTLAAVQSTVQGYPGLHRDVQTYLKERVREVLTGASQAIVIRISGDDLATLRRKAHEVEERLEGVDGLVDLHVELQDDVPTILVTTDLAAAHRHGVKPGDIRRTASAFTQAIEVNDIWRPTRVFDVNVWSLPAARRSLSDIRALPMDTPRGPVPLDVVADVRLAPAPNAINREAVSRRIDVSADVGGRDLGSVVADVESALKQVEFPRGYHAEVLGESAERASAQSRLTLFAVVAGVAIFLLLQAAFGGWRIATLFFLTLPMSLVGGVLAAYLAGGVISLGSLVGFFTVFGIAARNGILLINHYQHLEQEEGMSFGPELILRGAQERLAPILMTAGATALALVPLAAAGDIPGHEIEHPMAIVILGGIVTSTALNLFLVPALYLRFARQPSPG